MGLMKKVSGANGSVTPRIDSLSDVWLPRTLDVQAVGVFDVDGRIQNFINDLKEEKETRGDSFQWQSAELTLLRGADAQPLTA